MTELVATPNFDDPANLSDLIKMESVERANNMQSMGNRYAASYASSGIKSHARSFEMLRSDAFLIQFATEILGSGNPANLLSHMIV